MTDEILLTGDETAYVLRPGLTVRDVKARASAPRRRHIHWYRRIGEPFIDTERDMGLAVRTVALGGTGLGQCRCGALKPLGTR